MTLVVGTTGMVGTEICRLSPRPAGRSGARPCLIQRREVENLKRLGVTIVQGNCAIAIRSRPPATA